MKPKTYVYYCDSCDERFNKLVDFDARESTDCPVCEATCQRTWSGWSPVMNTRQSATMTAETGKGRFNKLREQQMLKKEKAHAREHGDRTTEKLIDQERKKL